MQVAEWMQVNKGECKMLWGIEDVGDGDQGWD